MSETRVRFKDRVLVDNLYDNAVDRYQLKSRRRTAVILLLVIVVVIAVILYKSFS